ncbi:MAG: 4'-phosphopantetheinyl transferase, partial [Leptolyngbyaceae cyanobacterium CSU_1_4]|nr:4'-phosphopantetheinyl transferase [Leptolyngbyaceae cyanobacterium CSU_1_4]
MAHFIWLTPPVDIQLHSDQVDVWRVALTVQPDSVQQMESTFSADEIQRASRFHFEKDRHRYIVAHARLRDILARYFQCKPHELKFS